jgi:hypothetical protein
MKDSVVIINNVKTKLRYFDTTFDQCLRYVSKAYARGKINLEKVNDIKKVYIDISDIHLTNIISYDVSPNIWTFANEVTQWISSIEENGDYPSFGYTIKTSDEYMVTLYLLRDFEIIKTHMQIFINQMSLLSCDTVIAKIENNNILVGGIYINKLNS